MAEAATKLPVKTEDAKSQQQGALQTWRPFDALRREVDRLFNSVEGGFLSSPFRRSLFEVEPFWRGEPAWAAVPAVDIAEKDRAYEITAELPGIDEKNVEVTFASGMLSIKGEKHEEKEEKKKDYHLQERRYGSFERSFRVPEGVDTDKIEANFKKGVLKVVLPKTAEAQKAEKKIAIKPA
jgi:HSP20 family protein